MTLFSSKDKNHNVHSLFMLGVWTSYQIFQKEGEGHDRILIFRGWLLEKREMNFFRETNI